MDNHLRIRYFDTGGIEFLFYVYDEMLLDSVIIVWLAPDSTFPFAAGCSVKVMPFHIKDLLSKR